MRVRHFLDKCILFLFCFLRFPRLFTRYNILPRYTYDMRADFSS